MSGGRRLFRRAGAVDVCVGGIVYRRRGVISAAAPNAVDGLPDYQRCGRVPTPLYRYFGDATELLCENTATIQTPQAVYTVLRCVPVVGPRGHVCVEALLEERREEDDGI